VKAGWEVKPLGEVTSKIGSGATPKGGRNAYKQEGIALIRSMNVHDLQFRLKDLARIDDAQAAKLSIVEIEENDVLLNITGASIARCCVVPSETLPARVNQHVAIIRPDPNEIDSGFLAYLLVSKDHKDTLLGIGDDAGATRQALTKSHIQNYPIPIPPLEEQKRIVAVLDAAFEGLTRAKENAETNLKNARELFEEAKDEILTASDGSWLNGTLEVLVGPVSTGPFGSLLHKSDYVPNETPIVNPAHIISGRIVPDMNKTIGQNTLERLGSYVMKTGDIVFGRRGDMGRCATVSELENGWLCGTGSFYIRPKQDVETELVSHLLRSRSYVKTLESLSIGATMLNISNKTLAGLEMTLPPAVGQLAMLEKINELETRTDQIKREFAAKLTDIAELRQSLLQKAFAGELT
jgi:type I restriction enzyme S subunit